MRIEIGSSKVLTTDWKTKHIPIWNIQNTQDLSLPKNLSFAPDLQITLIQKGWFGRENDVAEINIPLSSINEDFSEPKFYQFYSYGESKGKLLAIFNISEYDPKKIQENDFDKAVKCNSDILTHANIKMGIMGLRNLAGATNDMKMEIKLLYLKPNKDSGYTMGTRRPEEEIEIDQQEEPKVVEQPPQDEEESMNSINDDDEEMGLHEKKEVLERKSVTPELMQELKRQHDENAKQQDTQTPDLENGITRTGAEVGSGLKGVRELEPLDKNPTTSPNFCEIVTFEDVPF